MSPRTIIYPHKVNEPPTWKPLLCRLGLHRWRSGVAMTRKGTYQCERCCKGRTGWYPEAER